MLVRRCFVPSSRVARAEVERTRRWVSLLCPWEAEEGVGFATDGDAAGAPEAPLDGCWVWEPLPCPVQHPAPQKSKLWGGERWHSWNIHEGVGWRIWLRQDAAAASCAVNEIPSPLFSWNYGFCHGKILESRGLFCSPRHTAFAGALGNGKGGCWQQRGPRLKGW